MYLKKTTTHGHTIAFRNATLSDMPGILHVEQSWSESGRAGEDKFRSRLARFAQGFFVVCLLDTAQKEKIIAHITSMPFDYNPVTITSFQNWNQATNDGYIFEHYDLSLCNAIYIVSGVIDVEYRGLDIFEPAVLQEVALAQQIGMRYIVAGAVMPGYQRYSQKHGDTDAYEYCMTRRGKHLADPLLARYEGIGFHLPDRGHVKADYYPDEASRNYSALVVRDLNTTPL